MGNIEDNYNYLDILACPETKLKLTLCPLNEAEKAIAGENKLCTRDGVGTKPFGPTPTVLLRNDHKCAYPVIDGTPILLSPERLTAPDNICKIDLGDHKYAEAYEEMEFYNELASKEAETIKDTHLYKTVAPLLGMSEADRETFPDPKTLWLDAVYDCAAQWDGYKHIAPVKGKRILQIGGKGSHAAKFLLAGAEESWLITPMVGEVRCAVSLAKAAGVMDRLRCVVGITEELPFTSDSFDAIYTGGCLHHMVTSLAIPECDRILRPDGRFVAIEPWQAPFYKIGTKIFGKRVEEVSCVPLTKKRMKPFYTNFVKSQVIYHGALTRYLLLALHKLGLRSKLSTVWRINQLDDAFCSIIPGLRKLGSSIALLAEK